MSPDILYYDQGTVADEAALRFLRSMLGDSKGHLRLVYITEKPSEVLDERRRDLAQEQRSKQNRSEAEEALAKARKIVGDIRIELETMDIEGDPVREVNRLLVEKGGGGYDLLILRAYGRGVFSKDILGAHAKSLVQHATSPILIHKGQLDSCEKVLIHVPAESQRCLEFIRYMANLLGGAHPAVTFLAVFDEEHKRFEGYTSAEEKKLEEALEHYDRKDVKYLEEARKIMNEAGFEVEIRRRTGDLTEEILNEARSGRYDLLAFAPEEPGLLMSLWQGDESFEIMRDVEISVLKFPREFHFSGLD